MMARTLEVIVEQITHETAAIKSFKLVSADRSPLPRFSGGSHITTYLQTETGLIERHYSLTSDPDNTGYYRIAVRRNEDSNGGSIYWHDHVKEGDKISISYPKNYFPLSFQAKRHLFFAAGIGITPFLSMAKELKKKKAPFEIHYAAPSKELCAFYRHLSTFFSEETHFYFSKENKKMSTKLMENQPIGTHVYFCGPEAMIKGFADAAKVIGYSEKSIHFELFTPPKSGPMQPFRVKLNKSNKVIEVPEGKSLLDTLLQLHIDVPYSCKIGGCGSCQLHVLKGEIDHRDFFLTEMEKKESNVILTCVSRAKSGSLVLDL
ncbi:oxidoreductase [Bacillaceae bacterium ZC4]|jgi:ferredoxin-NADP reductase|uniref:PDR/VanB family oxidoreductase n=2 Tax=Aeribacillus composti TaxID=1868734 RepID=A0ABY9WF96_9BACI|nr:PDR/VanB family oxidoreductase [Aeribacillus composti]AXI39498.1 oxidoreductase [Bacillaceae bacterium ZC4]TVZ77963.1 ferredoxin-NADP reductase [Aeribacillus composti]WNF34283.1 PDR/VanB family oxidoreductase [Aeribacillus composti]